MKIKILLVIFTLIIVIGLSNQNLRWLVLNGLSASNYSKSLIKGGTVKAPDWTLDYVVNASPSKELVIFSQHDYTVVYAYSTNGTPSDEYHEWNSLIFNWYSGTFRQNQD